MGFNPEITIQCFTAETANDNKKYHLHYHPEIFGVCTQIIIFILLLNHSYVFISIFLILPHDKSDHKSPPSKWICS